MCHTMSRIFVRRMVKKAGRQGHSERRDEAYGFGYVEFLSDARTKPTTFFTILLRLNRTRFPWTVGWITILFKEVRYGSTLIENFKGASVTS